MSSNIPISMRGEQRTVPILYNVSFSRSSSCFPRLIGAVEGSFRKQAVVLF